MAKCRKSSVILRIVIYISLGIFSAYVGTYSIFSLYGGYCYSQSGDLRYYGTMSVSDIVQWEPQGCWYQAEFRNINGEIVSRGNDWGYFYSPLIRIDRKYFHKTMTLQEFENGAKETRSPTRGSS
jgi:hypothetical protein